MIPSPDEIEEELRYHVEARAADLARRGRTPQQARREAQVEFGSVVRYVEEGREAKGGQQSRRMTAGFATAWRSLCRSPLFVFVAVGTLAFGIGVATLVGSLARSVLLVPVQYPDAERIYNARLVAPAFASIQADLPVSALHFATWRQKCTVCEAVTLIDGGAYRLAGDSDRIRTLEVTPEFFRIIGTKVQAGRVLRSGEVGPMAPRVAMLTHAAWRTRLDADPHVVGRSVTLDEEPTEIIGVLPERLSLPRGEQLGELMQFPPAIDMVLPSRLDVAQTRPAGFQWSVLVKVRPGVTQARAEEELHALTGQLAAATRVDLRARLVPLQQQLTGGVQQPLQWLTIAAALLWLIACANFGTLQLARTAARRKALAIHATLGASRRDLLWQTLSENFLLVAAGGLAGLGLAAVGLWQLRLYAPAFVPRLEEVVLHPGVWAMALGVAAVAGMAGTVAPWWRMARLEASQALQLESRRVGLEDAGERRLRQTLLFGAAAFSLALASVAALLGVSFAQVLYSDHGFAREQISTLQISTPAAVTSGEARRDLHGQLLATLRSLPGVMAAGSTNRLPLQGETYVGSVGRVSGQKSGLVSNWRMVSPGYFAAAGTQLRAGREFAESDRGQRVAVISERVAREMFPNASPLGQMIFQQGGAAARIVGVAAEVKAKRIDARAPLLVYLPDWLNTATTPKAYYVLKLAGDAPNVIANIQEVVAGLGMELPADRIAPMQRFVEQATEARRWQSFTLIGFAVAGVFIACLGLAGVVTLQVNRRTAEVGMKLALGATRRQAARALLVESLRPVWLGLLAGAAVSLILGTLLQPQLYNVSPHDPFVLLGTTVVVGLEVLAAAYLAVFRAMRLDPAQALRAE